MLVLRLVVDYICLKLHLYIDIYRDILASGTPPPIIRYTPPIWSGAEMYPPPII